MKSIYYLFITTIISLTLTSSIQETTISTKSYILQPANKNINSVLLKNSADIIAARLKYYGLESFEVTAVNEKNQIKVQLEDNIEISEIEGLLTSKGELAFYETAGKNNFADLLKNNNAGEPLLIRSDVESIISSVDKDSQTVVTQIKFRPAAITVWAEATKRNLNKSIAIVIDDKVFYTPVVRDPIENGACEITGNLSEKEVRYFLSLVNNGQLSQSFMLLR
jgi:preprotein translocase subunit SecD